MADGFGYGGFSGAPYPFCLSSPPPPPPSASAPPFLAPPHPVYLTQGGFDPTTSHHRSPSDWSIYPSYVRPSLSQTPSSSLYVNNGSYGHRGEDTYAYMLPPNPSSSSPYDYVPLPTDYLLESQRLDNRMPYKFSVSPVQSSATLPSSSVEPVNFNVLVESTGLCNGTVGSTGSRSPRALHCDSKSSEIPQGSSGVSSLYQTPKTFLADSENGASETSLKNAIDDLNCDEHRSWNHFMEGPSAPTVESVAVKADNGNAAVNRITTSDGCANQPSEDVQACNLQKHMFDNKTSSLTDTGIKDCSKSNADVVSTGRLPERHLCDQGSLASPASCPRVTSLVNAMHHLSEVLVYECFNNGSWLKPEQLEKLDKVVENLTKCLTKITGDKTVAAEASIPTQAMHVDLNEASNVVAKDCEGVKVKPLDSFGLKEPVDKDNKNEDEMTQGIKNMLASNFLDCEENHPQTLLYKSLWLETEAALCSTTCMTRYRRIKNEIGNLKLQNREISADASTFVQEPFINPQKPVSVMNNVEQEATESLNKQGSNIGKDIVTMSHDAPLSNSDPVNAVLSLMPRSFMGGLEQEHHTATSGMIPDAIQQEFPAASTEEKHNDGIDWFKILKQQETKRKLKSQNCSKTRNDDQEEIPEANSEVAHIGRMSDVMDRFKILKRREAEQVQTSLNSLDMDSESDKDQPRNKTQSCDHPRPESMMMIIGGNSVKETCADTEEPFASGEGCESPTSDWEHVRKDN